MTIVGTAEIPVNADMAPFQRDMQRGADSAVDSMASRLQTRGRSLFRSGAVMSAGLTAPIIAGFGSAINAASDLAESASKVTTIFGDQAPEIEQWAESAATSLGLSEGAALDAAGGFGNMFTQLGIGVETASDMSQGIVGLAADFASFHNADISEVIAAQSAAFRGEYDSLQRFLPLINAATVEQRALEMTGKRTTAELTAQDRALAVNALMMEGAGEAAGDFARTAGGAANQQRILSAQFQNAAAAIGQQLLPVAMQLLDWVQQAITWFANLGQPMQGIILGALGLVAAIGPVVSLVGALTVAIGFLISPVGLVILAIAALAAGAIYAYTHFEGFRTAVDAVVQWLVGTAWPMIQSVAGFIAAKFGELVGWVQVHWAAIQEAIGHVIAVVQAIIEGYVGYITFLWQTFGQQLVSIAQAAWEFIRSTVENGINLVRSVIEAVLALINGDWGAAWTAIRAALSAVWAQIQNIVTTAMSVVRDVVSAGIAAISALWSAGWEALRRVVTEAWERIRSGVSSAIGEVVALIRGLPGRILSALGDLGSLLYQKGRDIVLGMMRGIRDALPGLNALINSIRGDNTISIGGTTIRDGRIVGQNAAGTSFWKGGLTWVGEYGPELVSLPRGSQVSTTEESMSKPSGSREDPAVWDAIAERMAHRYSRTLMRELRTV